jgi:hypothetical protein
MLKKISEQIFRILFTAICLSFFLQVNAQDTEQKNTYFRGYSGGMMLHTGYLTAGKIIMPGVQEKIHGAPWGIGGLIRFHFGKHLRLGGEGYTSTLYYGKNKSYTTLNWGGLLMDCQWKINKFTVFCGGTIGGGSVKNIALSNDTSIQQGERNALFRKYTLMVAAPFVGMEYAITSRIRFITKVDGIFNIMGKQPDFTIGPRIYAGIVFFHEKK